MPDSLDLRGGFEVETPEQVAFRLERAGLGSRILAAMIDTVLLVVLYGVAAVGLVAVVPDGGQAGADSESSALWMVGLFFLLLSFLMWAYYIGFELAWNGQTPGKRLLGIRVVADSGVPAAPGQIVIRNLLRLVDFQLFYAVAMVAIFATRDERRLGDLAAGTIVVSERRPDAEVRPQGKPTAAGRALDPRLLDLVRNYWARAGALDHRTRWELAREVANRLAEALGRPPVPASQVESSLREMTALVLQDSRSERGERAG